MLPRIDADDRGLDAPPGGPAPSANSAMIKLGGVAEGDVEEAADAGTATGRPAPRWPAPSRPRWGSPEGRRGEHRPWPPRGRSSRRIATGINGTSRYGQPSR